MTLTSAVHVKIIICKIDSQSIGLMHDDVLLINFTTKTRIQTDANVSQRIEIEKNFSMEGERSVQIVHGSEAWW